MSRSRRTQCRTGRGCSCCGDAGAARRARDRAWAKSLGIKIPKGKTEKETGGRFHHDPYYQGKSHRP